MSDFDILRQTAEWTKVVPICANCGKPIEEFFTGWQHAAYKRSSCQNEAVQADSGIIPVPGDLSTYMNANVLHPGDRTFAEPSLESA